MKDNYSSFAAAIDVVIGFEGGYVNDPDDPGGETNWGISKRCHPQVDIKNLSKAEAEEIYRNEYWEPLRTDDIEHPLIQIELFDTAVNLGPQTACLILQEALFFLGYRVERDGVMGLQTINATNKASFQNVTALFKVLNGLQFMHYYKLVKANPKLKRFAAGWMRRIQGQREINDALELS